MKRIFYVLAVFGLLTVSCKKDDPANEEKALPTVSISADASFNAENIAKLTVSLSAAGEKDVVVKLAEADVQSGKTKVPAVFGKTVTIAGGKTSAVIDVEADLLGLESGDYQSAIKIESAEGATLGATTAVYINFTYVSKPTVNLYAEAQFAGDRTVTLKVALSKATTAPVTVTLETDPESKITLEYETTITVPAGETEAETVVTAKLADDIVPGIYPGIIKIASIENGIAGNVASIKIDLSYPFAVSITVDGNFDDWNDPNVSEWSLPEGEVLYQSIKKLKLAANGKYVFAYMEFDDPGFDFNMPFNMYVDADGNPATGGFSPAVDNDTPYPPYDTQNMGLEYYIEVALHDGDNYYDFYSDGGIYKYEGVDGEIVFTGLTNLSGSYDGSAIYAAGSLEGNTGRIEIQLLRSWFGMTGNKARFAVKNMDGVHNWAAYGLLPQGNVVDGVRQLVDMASIYLPAHAE